MKKREKELEENETDHIGCTHDFQREKNEFFEFSCPERLMLRLSRGSITRSSIVEENSRNSLNDEYLQIPPTRSDDPLKL